MYKIENHSKRTFTDENETGVIFEFFARTKINQILPEKQMSLSRKVLKTGHLGSILQFQTFAEH